MLPVWGCVGCTKEHLQSSLWLHTNASNCESNSNETRIYTSHLITIATWMPAGTLQAFHGVLRTIQILTASKFILITATFPPQGHDSKYLIPPQVPPSQKVTLRVNLHKSFNATVLEHSNVWSYNCTLKWYSHLILLRGPNLSHNTSKFNKTKISVCYVRFRISRRLLP